VGGGLSGGGEVYVLPGSLRFVADVRAARTKEKIGHSGRDDRPGESGRRVALKGVGGDFGIFGGPIVGGKGDAPKFGGGFEEIDADFGFAFGGGSDVDYADELFFESFDVADENFLAQFDTRGHDEKCAVGADVGGEGVFGDVLVVVAASHDEDGETEENALTAAAVGNGGVVGGGSGHGGDGLRNSVGEEAGKVKRRKVLKCA
jgi:hypothetical protein